jgi:hypothetical protein
MPASRTESTSQTLSFKKFWSWLSGHANCILRAGTTDAVLFDHEDYHWHLSVEPQEETLFLVQLVRGKELVAEMLIMPNEIAYVQCEQGEGEEFIFECIIESPQGREAAWHFVLSHGYDDGEAPTKEQRWTH